MGIKQHCNFLHTRPETQKKEFSKPSALSVQGNYSAYKALCQLSSRKKQTHEPALSTIVLFIEAILDNLFLLPVNIKLGMALKKEKPRASQLKENGICDFSK